MSRGTSFSTVTEAMALIIQREGRFLAHIFVCISSAGVQLSVSEYKSIVWNWA